MQTITFYSFKGGTGRSLLLSQLAMCLAAIGKTVCVLDFDLEAPGIECKFPSKSLRRLDPTCDGSAMYIQSFLEGTGRNYVEVCNSCGNDMPWNLPEDCSLRMPMIEGTHSMKVGQGRIHIISAGQDSQGSDSYWRTLVHPRFSKFMSYGHRFAEFFHAMKERISLDLDPSPDYLLVDSRSGVNELSGICTRILADKVVVLCGVSEDGLRGTNAVLRSLEHARRTSCDPPGLSTPIRSKVFLAVSKLPRWTQSHSGRVEHLSDEQVKDRMLSVLCDLNEDLFEPYLIDEVFPLSLAPLLHFEERLPISFSGPALQNRFTTDCIDFFGALLREEEPSLAWRIRSRVGEVREVRPYLIDFAMGKMINPQDNSWNVAFRVDTQLGTLEGLYNAIAAAQAQLGQSRENARSIADAALFGSGEAAAEGFASNLEETWSKASTLGVSERLEDWCKFDSSVGFGHFDYNYDEATGTGKIVLKNNFLIYRRDATRPNLCSFMLGYISRVLKAVFNAERVDVFHDRSTECGQFAEHKDCVFRFKLKEEGK